MEEGLKIYQKVSSLPEKIESFLNSISRRYHELFRELYPNDLGCIRSSVALTGILSHNFNLPIGYDTPGIKLAYGYKKNGIYHAWDEIMLPEGDFYTDAMFGNTFDEKFKNRIMFRKIGNGFFQEIDLTKCDEKRIPRLLTDCMDHPEGLEYLYEILTRFEFVLKINESGSIDAYLRNNEKLRTIYNEFLIPFRDL